MSRIYKRIVTWLMVLALIIGNVPYTASADIITEFKDALKERYTVLLLETSNDVNFDVDGSILFTATSAKAEVIDGAIQFINDVEKASGKNHVAIIRYSSSATVVSDFSSDYTKLRKDLQQVDSSLDDAGRNLSDGLNKAYELLNNVSGDNCSKNVVLFSTGMVDLGEASSTGKYNESTPGSSWCDAGGTGLYEYANGAIQTADKLKNKNISIYSIGLFKNVESMPQQGKEIADLFENTLKYVATDQSYYIRVIDTDQLAFAFGQVAEDVARTSYCFKFTYSDDKNYEADCWYSDDYFMNSSYEYNPSMATTSLCFAMSAFGSANGGDYTTKSENARKFLNSIGIADGDISCNDNFTVKPTTDSIGAVCGSKKVYLGDKEYTLIALAVRGGGYEREWASNFTIGLEGQHQGFAKAKRDVLDFLRSYIKDKGITGPVKLWLTGYSRAGATANLVAGAIDNGESLGTGITYENKDVYAYCLEPPKGALKSEINDKKYNNIFNIINPADPVPYVAPAELGFARFGVDKFVTSMSIGNSMTDLLGLRVIVQMKENYVNMPNKDEYVLDQFKMKKISLGSAVKGNGFITEDEKNNFSQSECLKEVIRIISEEAIISRENYVDLYQEGIRELFSILYGCTKEQKDKLLEVVVAEAKGNWSKIIKTGLFSMDEDPYAEVSRWLIKGVEDAGITNYSDEALDKAGKVFGRLIVKLAVSHPNYAVTLVENVSLLGAAHYPELCYAWLTALDPSFNKDLTKGQDATSDGKYRVVRINCPVDIEIVGSNGQVVARITDDMADTSVGSGYIYGVDGNGQKYVYLPIDSEYTVNIVARENGIVNYSISEESLSDMASSRVVNYFDIELKKGETIVGTVPAVLEAEAENYDKGTNTPYKLSGPDGKEIAAASDVKGSKEADKSYAVRVQSSDGTMGVALGGGVVGYGQFVKVEAQPEEGFSFYGWYKGDELVSTETSYRFCVKEATELVALFGKTILPCGHSDGVILKSPKAPTCTEKGYTGDVVCKQCGDIYEQGKELEPTGHRIVDGHCTICEGNEADTIGLTKNAKTPKKIKQIAFIVWIGLWCGVGLTVVISIVTAIVKRSKRKNNLKL